jgi:hypothetical protein
MNWASILKAAGGALFGGRGGGTGGNMMPGAPQWGGGARGMPGFGGVSGPGGGIPGQEVMRTHGEGDRQKFLGLDSDWAAIIARMLQGVGGYFGDKRGQDLEESRYQEQLAREKHRGALQGDLAALMLGLGKPTNTGAPAGSVVSGPAPTPSPTISPSGNLPPDLEEQRRRPSSRFGGMFRPRGPLG